MNALYKTKQWIKVEVRSTDWTKREERPFSKQIVATSVDEAILKSKELLMKELEEQDCKPWFVRTERCEYIAQVDG